MKTQKKLIVCLLSLALMLCSCVVTVCADSTGYLASFSVTGGSGTITVYNDQNYTSGTVATSAYARDGESGDIDTTGSGQINFTVTPASGYEVESVTATAGTYKNIKGPSDTGKENTYRITKISGDTTVTVTLKASGSGETGATTGEATVKFTNTAASITAGTSDGIVIDGTAVTISLPGTYTFSGSCTDGNILVAKNAGDVEIVLKGLTLTSTTTAPIAAKSGTSVKIKAEKGTVNTLTDTDREAASPKSCINAGGSLEFAGKGTLNVNGNNKNGIKADEDLTIENITLNVVSVDNCIAADSVLTIESGNITCKSTGGDCLKASPDEITDATPGNIVISGGTLNLTADAGDAIQAVNTLTITGGTFKITTNGGSTTEISDTDEGSYKGIKSDDVLVINGGTFNIDTADDAIHSDNSVSISGGEFTIASGDDGIHADSALNISGGNIEITKCYEGLEATDITIDDGYVDITASDDGINICGGTDNSGMRPGFGITQTDDETAEAGTLTFNGGTVIVNAAGDGLDSNGNIVMNGGTVVVNGPTSNGDGAIDYETGFTMNGGTIIAVGSSGMASGITGGTQASVKYTLNRGASAGTTLCIKDSNGNTVAVFKSAKAFSSVVYSSADIENGKSYTLYTGCSASGENAGGLYADNSSCTGGTQQATATASTSNGGNQGGPGGGIPGGREDGGEGTGIFAKIIEFFRKIANWFKNLLGIA